MGNYDNKLNRFFAQTKSLLQSSIKCPTELVTFAEGEFTSDDWHSFRTGVIYLYLSVAFSRECMQALELLTESVQQSEIEPGRYAILVVDMARLHPGAFNPIFKGKHTDLWCMMWKREGRVIHTFYPSDDLKSNLKRMTILNQTILR